MNKNKSNTIDNNSSNNTIIEEGRVIEIETMIIIIKVTRDKVKARVATETLILKKETTLKSKKIMNYSNKSNFPKANLSLSTVQS